MRIWQKSSNIANHKHIKEHDRKNMLSGKRIMTLVTIVVTVSVMLMAKGRGQNDYFYSRWTVFTTQQLMDKAKQCVLAGEKRDSAMVWYTIVANRFDPKEGSRKENNLSLRAMNNLGYMYFFFYYDYQKSYSYLTKALKLSQKYGYGDYLPYIYLNMGNLCCIGRGSEQASPLSDKAIAYYKKSFAEGLRHKTWDIVCIAVNNMMLQAYSTQHIAMIEPELNAFVKARIPHGTPLLAYSRHLAKAMQLTSVRRYGAALQQCDMALKKIDDKLTPERYLLSATFIKAHIHSLAGNKQQAIALVDEVQHMAEVKGMKDWLVDIYREYSVYYKLVGNETQYRKYRMMYLEAQDSILTESKLQVVNDMQFLDELKAADERVAEAVRRRREQTIAMWVALGVTVVVGIMLTLLAVAYRRLRQKNRLLYDKSVSMMRRYEAERQQRQMVQQAAILQQDTVQRDAESPVSDIMAEAGDDTGATKQPAISDEMAMMLMDKIKGVMDDVDVIANQDFSLKRLAELVGEKYWTVSQVINNSYGNNFNALLAEYRINEACRRLTDKEHSGRLTIEAIAQSLGFKSRSNFAATFKRITGLTPSEFQKMAKSA